MGLFSKKADPITSKAKALNQQIAALELEIKRLHRKIDKPQTAPARDDRAQAQSPMRSTATPAGLRHSRVMPREPIFESVEQGPPQAATDAASAHFNDLGVRKYDLPGAWRRLLSYFRSPSAHNPKLVNYLAAGSIRGLRPLRYEKRVARNRFVVMSIIFFVALYWLTAMFWRHR